MISVASWKRIGRWDGQGLWRREGNAATGGDGQGPGTQGDTAWADWEGAAEGPAEGPATVMRGGGVMAWRRRDKGCSGPISDEAWAARRLILVVLPGWRSRQRARVVVPWRA